jgi:integrase
VVLVTTGLRLGEALALRWQDVDRKRGRLTVGRALQRRRGGGLHFVEPKTGRSRRTVQLAAGTIAALQLHHDRQGFEHQALGEAWADSGLVFTTTIGTPVQPETVSVALRKALAACGLDRVRVHDLRHTAATLQLEWGTHPKVVQEMLGHSTISITLDLYSHVAPAMHQEAAKRFGRLF